jgi:uncharacterized protein (DUF2252 family)
MVTTSGSGSETSSGRGEPDDTGTPALGGWPAPRATPRLAGLTMAERAARGRAARAAVPRSSLGAWRPDADRPDPVALLEEQATSRVPELVPIRHGRMLVSPFTFFRGAAYVMASDLASSPRSGLEVQLCGDAHLANFGIFAAPDRHLVFSVNDFDETLPGPFEWDVKRLVASFAVAGRDRGFDTRQRRSINLNVARSYRTAMQGFSRSRTLDLWYARLDVDEIVRRFASAVSKAELRQFERDTAKARTKDSLKAFAKLTHLVDGQPRIVSDPPLIVPIRELLAEDAHQHLAGVIQDAIESYEHTLEGDRRHLLRRFRYVDGARKVVGVGSVGTRAWIVLLVGSDDGDPLLLQLKEAQQSVLEPFLGQSAFASHGQRVVEGQRLMQASSDILLGWFSMDGIDGKRRDFYLRQLWDGKGSLLVDALGPRPLEAYAEICGWTLARAHARSGDPVAIASYLGVGTTFDQAMAEFAELYADQNERDHVALQQAVDAGRISALRGY